MKGAMKDIFKKKISELKKGKTSKNFTQALYSGSESWAIEDRVLSEMTYPEKDSSSKNEVKKTAENLSSLSKNQWSKSHFSELKPSLILNEEFVDIILRIKNPHQSHQLLQQESEHIDNLSQNRIRVIFLIDELRPLSEFQQDLNQAEHSSLDDKSLLISFPVSTASLFSRMMRAMNLSHDEYLLYPIESITQDGQVMSLDDDIKHISMFYKPDVIVPLGAKSTQHFLERSDRLTVIHGKFFSKELSSDYKAQVMPLFHPRIIETNLNMKKTAWQDMQKIMNFLKKLT